MKYRIRKWASYSINKDTRIIEEYTAYIPSYKKKGTWLSPTIWVEDKPYSTIEEAQGIIDKWIKNGVSEEADYIKYP